MTRHDDTYMMHFKIRGKLSEQKPEKLSTQILYGNAHKNASNTNFNV